ncbi:MAG: hypothetical protein KGV57_02290 [Fusobacterium sp.]|nr:hypothetical protein [Fusobacterium sp.]
MAKHIKMKEAFEKVKGLGVTKSNLVWLIKTEKIPKCFFKKKEDKLRGSFIIDEEGLSEYFKI